MSELTARLIGYGAVDIHGVQLVKPLDDTLCVQVSLAIMKQQMIWQHTDVTALFRADPKALNSQVVLINKVLKVSAESGRHELQRDFRRLLGVSDAKGDTGD